MQTFKNLLSSTLCLGGILSFYMSAQALSGALQAVTLSEKISTKISSGFDPIYQVTWAEAKCDGVLGKVQSLMLPASCPIKIKIWRSGDKDKAISKLSENHGALGLSMIEERGPLEKDFIIYWKPDIKKRKGGLWH